MVVDASNANIGLGRGSMDLLIEWKNVRHVIEIKKLYQREVEHEGKRIRVAGS